MHPLLLSPLLKHTTDCLLCLHPLFGLHKYSANIKKYQWVSFFFFFFLFMEEFNDTLCSTYTSMLEVILSDCPSASICHTASKYNGILTGKLIVCCHTPASTSDVVIWHNQIGCITFGAALVCVCNSTNMMDLE